MKTSILAQVSALAGGVGSHVVNHPNPTHDLLSKKSRMKAFGPATVVHGREQYSRSVQYYEAPPPCADTVGWVDAVGKGCDWYANNDELGCPAYGYFWDGVMGVAADNCCHCAGTSEDDTTAATTTTSSTLAIEVDNTTAPADDTTAGGNPTPTPMPVAVKTSGGHIGKVVGMAIAGVSVFSFMALAIYYLRRMASNANSPQKNTAGSDIPMAVVVNMDPETAEAPLSKGNPLRPPYAPHASAPPPYAPHSSAPPPYAPHASAPPLE